MANLFLWANNASSSLAGPITSSATSLTVASGDGSKFPNPSAGEQFALTLNDAATGLLNEIVYCTARSGDVLTIVRAQESTAASAWIAGDLCANLVTAGSLAAFVQQVTVSPNRVVTTSGAFTITTADANGAIGLARVSSVGPSSATLPSNAVAGQTYTIEDLAANFQPNPVTISAPGAQTIAGLSSVQLNQNRQSATFRFYGSNVWGVSKSS